MDSRIPLYRTIWRWHFYAGLFVIPFILILSLTGAIYLFKPQIDAWEESGWRDLPGQNAVSADVQVAAARAAVPGAIVYHYRVPQKAVDAAVVHVGLPSGAMRDIAVTPQGRVLAVVDPEQRWSAWLARLHGSLLAGTIGGLLVELAASWAMVMILTGLYLWWPRGRGMAGVVWLRLNRGARTAWHDAHAVTGFWVSGLALVLLLTGLPWTDVWATGFRALRAEMGWTAGAQTWKGGVDLHAHHDHGAVSSFQLDLPSTAAIGFDDIVLRAQNEALPAPVVILPPGAPAMHGPPNGAQWTLTSHAQNRTLIQRVSYDPATGLEVARSGFADKHVIDRVINIGIAWHEGALFGRLNQLIGVLTALMLMALAVSGFVMWRRRRPDGALGAPPVPSDPSRLKGVTAIILLLAVMLPMLAASLILLWLFDRLLLPRLPRLAQWLGVQKVSFATG